MIDAPAGADFTFKELSESGSGGTGGGTGGGAVVPTPSAAGLSLAGLCILGVISVTRRARHQTA